MRKIGITGGVGAGKSTILEHLEKKYNAKIYLADRIAHYLEEPGRPCYNELVSAFGNSILDDNAYISPKEFATVIFNDKNALEKVNSIIHPQVKKFILEKINEEEENGTELFVLEAALLIEDGYLNILDEIWYIHTDDEIRRARLKASRGYSDEKIDSIMAKQMSPEEFRKYCRYTIDNSGSEEDTRKELDKILGVK